MVKLGSFVNKRKDNNRKTKIKKEMEITRNVTKSAQAGKNKNSTWRVGWAIKHKILKITNGFIRM